MVEDSPTVSSRQVVEMLKLLVTKLEEEDQFSVLDSSGQRLAPGEEDK